MNQILDQFQPKPSFFRPKSHGHVLAVRLAHKLGDPESAAHYVSLLGEHSEERLLTAYHRAQASGGQQPLGKRFHAELAQIHGNPSFARGYKLMAVRVERRAVAAAVFHGEHLEYTQVRQLSSDKDRALVSAAGFINWMVEHLPVDCVAMEEIESGQAIHRRVVHDVVSQTIRAHMLPIWNVSKNQLFTAFGYPSLRGRAELRQVIGEVWPVLVGGHGKAFIQDAAALGLYVQTERLFIIN